MIPFGDILTLAWGTVASTPAFGFITVALLVILVSRR